MSTITSRCQQIPLRPVPQAVVKQYLEMHGADEDRATLLARLSSGRIGWALNALKDETPMQERNDMLNMLHEVITSNRVRRFEIAEELDKIGRKDKTALRYLLETWQTYWRDVLLMASGSPVKPCNTDRTEIQQLLYTIQADDALKALKVTREMLTETLKTNANLRMAFEVLFLDYPGLQSR
jgi:DNA polymerase-3 subunit delta'